MPQSALIGQLIIMPNIARSFCLMTASSAKHRCSTSDHNLSAKLEPTPLAPSGYWQLTQTIHQKQKKLAQYLFPLDLIQILTLQ